jgi:uncharacterized protein (TIGR02246 family)
LTDDDAIKATVAMYAETWNRNDMESWGKLFTENVDYVNRAGGWWRSNRDNVEGHLKIHEQLVKQRQVMDYKTAVEKIAHLAPGVALVHASWEWPSSATSKGLITMVMERRDGTWLIRALQNTVTTHHGSR